MIKLTQEEMITIWEKSDKPFEEICDAQIAKIHQWGNEPCPHFYLDLSGNVAIGEGWTTNPFTKHGCDRCWNELSK